MINVGFYIHHQGSGHLFRAIAIAKKLNRYSITFFGSGLISMMDKIPPNVNCIHLPLDYDENEPQHDDPATGVFHYAPLNVDGLRKRNAILTEWFASHWPCLLLVDVSVEIVFLARLCGVPTVMIKLNGDRNDLPHLSAFEACQQIIAPYPRWMEDDSTPQWVKNKTFFSGGFCRYEAKQREAVREIENQVVVMIGSGGTKMNAGIIEAIADKCPQKQFAVLGLSSPETVQRPNLVFHGRVADPLPFLQKAEVIIGSAGDNVVMEMAWLEKRFICIPEDRPFREQHNKADKLGMAGLAVVVESPAEANWPELFLQVKKQDTTKWQTVLDPQATVGIKGVIDILCNRLFQ